MPYPNEHAARINNPSKYSKFRRQNDRFGKGIHVIWGVPKRGGGVEVQSIRFDKNRFSVAEAYKWLSNHNYKVIKFEPSSIEEDFTTSSADIAPFAQKMSLISRYGEYPVDKKKKHGRTINSKY
ncbi:MAG: hypothetical protein QXG00_06640 [Candidatus Woesearchaeota archaeon]